MRAGVVQLNSTEDVDRNLATADRLVRDAAGRGAEVVLLPEKWSVLGSAAALEAGAEPLDGPVGRWAVDTARELAIDLVAGSIVERTADGALANTTMHVGPHGEVKAVYRKVHMFDVEVDGITYAESAHERAGDEIVVSTLADGTCVGLSICYDIRFPELYQALAARGAQLIVIPSAFTLATTRDHWEVLVRARAIETQSFVLAANQFGENMPGRRCGGRSLIVDPWGLVLAGAADRECAPVADLDFATLADVRRRLPSLAHRRPEVYA